MEQRGTGNGPADGTRKARRKGNRIERLGVNGMILLQANHIAKYFGAEQILTDVKLEI